MYERKINAHNGLALTLDWHPDGRYLVSGGRDKMIKIWDLQSDSRKPFHSIQTIASIAKVQFRPPSYTLPDSDPHIASCSLLTDNRTHLWTLNRPFVPVRSYDFHTNVTTGFLFRGSHLIWSISKDKTFMVVNVTEGSSMSMSSCSLSWDPSGLVSYFVGREERTSKSPGRIGQANSITYSSSFQGMSYLNSTGSGDDG